MTYKQKVYKLIRENNLSIGMSKDCWDTTTISLNAPTGFTLDGDLHGFNAYCDKGQSRELAWKDLYDRFDARDMEKCPANCDCQEDQRVIYVPYEVIVEDGEQVGFKDHKHLNTLEDAIEYANKNDIYSITLRWEERDKEVEGGWAYINDIGISKLADGTWEDARWKELGVL